MQDVCLFAHFDKHDSVDNYVWRYLAKLKELNFSIILVSTSRLSAADIARLNSVCDDVIIRDNKGLDFASWSAGFAKHGSAIGGRLLLANDSVYGPIGSLGDALERLTRTAADFYGMVESVEIAPHLQSWFVLLQPWVVRAAALKAVLAQPFAAMTRPQIVRAGEVGLSRQLMAAGFCYEALYRSGGVAGLPPRHGANPMLLHWRELLFDVGVPFLKIELLRDNPIGIEDPETILRDVERIDFEISTLIRSHLARPATDGPARPRPVPIARYRYALLRRYDRARSEHRLIAAALVRLQLEGLALPLALWGRMRRGI